MIIWWSKHVGVILSVLMYDIWINVLLQASALVGPLYIVNWNAWWNSEKPKVLTYIISIWNRLQALYRSWRQILHLFALLHDSRNWPKQHKWCAETLSVLLMFFIFPQSGYNTRSKAVHLVNTRHWNENLIAIFLNFYLKNKLLKRVSGPAH
jgi:hypothetical protein